MTDKKTEHARQYYQNNQTQLLDELLELLRIPSVSTDAAHEEDIINAVHFLKEKLDELEFDEVKIFSTPRHPILYAEKNVNHEGPTLLIYGHYDVQPPDPIDAWNNPPFEPSVENNKIFARGASDMKGQIWACVSALESTIKTGTLSVNVKLIIEGEEEIGSPSLESFLNDHKSLLACDFVLNPDAGMLAPEKPTITYSLRGLAYFELRLFGPKADLHSGIFGGVIDNPANVLSKVIAGMHDDQGRVTLPNFYNDVRIIPEDERLQLQKLGMDDAFYKNLTGVSDLGGEKDFQPIERIGARPTLDINGIYAGYIDKGAKTIIPAYAMAKISTRLVPEQDPDQIHESLRTYLEQNVPNTVKWELDYLSGAPGYIVQDQAPGIELFIDALRKTWGVEPLLKPEGGSIPVATSMKNILGVDSIITGFGLPDDHIHSPNERLHLPTHRKGVEAIIRFLSSF